MTEIKTKRAYEPVEQSDGFRVYIDKMWPRGLKKEVFQYDLWEKGIAPSVPLREWFHEDMDKHWHDFQKKYTEELKASPIMKEFISTLKQHKVVTLLYSSKDLTENNALILRDFLQPVLK